MALLLSQTDRFDVVYSRPRSAMTDAGYSPDQNQHCEYPDLALVGRFPKVLVLEDYCARAGAPYNRTKLEILAKTHLFVAVQGGGAHLLACFGRALMLVLHYQGQEDPHAYAAGPYKYLADPAPVLMVARTHEQLIIGLTVIAAARIQDGELTIDAGLGPALEALRV